jgi:hypothetical protein
MKKLTKKNLDELAKVMPVLNENIQRSLIGGGNGTQTNPYTETEFDQFLTSGYFPGGYILFNGDSSGTYLAASYATTDVVVTGSYTPQLPTINDSGILGYAGTVLSIAENVVEKGGKYIKVLNAAVTVADIYNTVADPINRQELTNEDIYNLAMQAIGSIGWQGAVLATYMDMYKAGADYFIKMTIELDNYIQNELNPATGSMWP